MMLSRDRFECWKYLTNNN